MSRQPTDEKAPMMDDDSASSGTVSTEYDERIIYFTCEVSESTVSNAIASMFTLQHRDAFKPIYMVIETFGGYVDSMFSLYDAMKFITCPVHTIALGKVMSAGVLILAAGEKGSRLIAPHARIMTHASSMSLSGNAFEIKNELAEAERQEDMWLDAMAAETGTKRQVFEELNNCSVDQYLTPQKCIELGIADRLMYDPKHVGLKGRAAARKPIVRATGHRVKKS